MKIFKVIMYGGLLLLIGCSGNQPKKSRAFNPNYKRIVFVSGKPYNIPYGTGYYKVDDKPTVSTMKSNGGDCRIGDVHWTESKALLEWKKDDEAGKIDDLNDRFRFLISSNKMGCVHLLSNQEYQFYKQKESERSARSVARMNYLKETAPKTVNYNVEHSGYIDYSGSVYHY